MSVRPTRWYSDRQEQKVAKNIGGKKTPGSGSTAFVKGDVLTNNVLIECKTCTEPRKQMCVKLDWIRKNEEEAFAMNKAYSAVAIDFGQGTNYYIINEKMFKRLMDETEKEG